MSGDVGKVKEFVENKSEFTDYVGRFEQYMDVKGVRDNKNFSWGISCVGSAAYSVFSFQLNSILVVN